MSESKASPPDFDQAHSQHGAQATGYFPIAFADQGGALMCAYIAADNKWHGELPGYATPQGTPFVIVVDGVVHIIVRDVRNHVIDLVRQDINKYVYTDVSEVLRTADPTVPLAKGRPYAVTYKGGENNTTTYLMVTFPDEQQQLASFILDVAANKWTYSNLFSKIAQPTVPAKCYGIACPSTHSLTNGTSVGLVIAYRDQGNNISVFTGVKLFSEVDFQWSYLSSSSLYRPPTAYGNPYVIGNSDKIFILFRDDHGHITAMIGTNNNKKSNLDWSHTPVLAPYGPDHAIPPQAVGDPHVLRTGNLFNVFYRSANNKLIQLRGANFDQIVVGPNFNYLLGWEASNISTLAKVTDDHAIVSNPFAVTYLDAGNVIVSFGDQTGSQSQVFYGFGSPFGWHFTTPIYLLASNTVAEASNNVAALSIENPPK